MLRSTTQLEGATVMAKDGDAGAISDVLFDDERWTVRYLVVKSGGWLTGRKILVSPISVNGADWVNRTLGLDLTRDQISNGPSIDADKPVSRQQEAAIFDHYGYPYYWGGPLAWGIAAYPLPPTGNADRAAAGQNEHHGGPDRKPGDPHLRSSKEVKGYDIRATDDDVGHVEDFLIDEKDWSIRFVVVDTRNWWPGKKVLIAPDRVERVSWQDRQMEVAITRAEVEGSPEFDPAVVSAGTERAGLYRIGNIPPF
jgi:uncharacterized protein YrrD